MGQEEKDPFPWLTALKQEREKVIRNHQNRIIQFENSSLETIFSNGLMLLGAGFFSAGILGSFGTVEVGQMAGLLLGVLLLYAGFLFILALGNDYGTLSALETILAAAKSKKDITAAWLKEIILSEMHSSNKPIFRNGVLANFLGLLLVIYGVYVIDLLLLKRLGAAPATVISEFVIIIASEAGGLLFFLIKEPYKRAKINGFKSALEIIRLSEHAPKAGETDEPDIPEGSTIYDGPGPTPEAGRHSDGALSHKEVDDMELFSFDPDDAKKE